MARPRLGEEERRTRTVGVRVTEAEAEELQERAQAARLSRGAYLRRRGGLGQRVRMAAERRFGCGRTAGAEPDRGESQSNGAGDELRRGGPGVIVKCCVWPPAKRRSGLPGFH